MEKRFFKNLLAGDQAPPSNKLVNELNTQFAGAINVEWFKKESDFEAVFYYNQLEHIASFDAKGNLMEYKINIPPTQLPPYIVETITTIGEIMSSVIIHKINNLFYEIIIRNTVLQRLVVVFNAEGEILERRFL